MKLVAALAALGALALGGCADPKLDRMLEVRDEVCKCKDAACVDAGMAKMPAKSPRDEKRAQEVARDILACVAQVGALAPGETPSEAPAEPTAGEAPAKK